MAILRIHVLAILLIFSLYGTQARAASCRFDHAEYRDTSGRGFLLKFKKAKDGMLIAEGALLHKERGKLLNFEISQSNGYGLVSLIPKGKSPYKTHEVYFFDSTLKPYHGSGASALLFVEGLGVEDYYVARDKVPDESLLGDTLWAFNACSD